ncbi:MAG: hypothetical protein IKB06_00560 [Clostridia bacterium]|nr:hypothetical protein [Clostridia bacterium]
MGEKNFRFPQFFNYLLVTLSVIIFAGMFFSVKIVGGVYFIAILLSVVFAILDKKYGKFLSNYKVTFFLFDLINLISVIAILYYEYSRHEMILNVFLILLIVIEVLMMIIDFFLIKNKNLSKNESFIVNVVKIASMICILTYFYKVSILFFAIDALFFEVASLVLKIYVNKAEKNEEINEPVEPKVEDIIQSAGKDEGDVE